jgi:predicted nuclease of predicted toxin-antitoxin system
LKLLIDECLSPTLATIARERGLEESTCVQWLGMSGQADHSVARRAVDEGYILVTHNTADFLPLYQQEEVHVGLIALNTAAGVMSLALQQRLLLLALQTLEGQERWNEVLEISVAADGTVTIEQYDLPTT